VAGRPAYFSGNQGGKDAMLPPEVLKLGIYIPIKDFKRQSSEDNFRNLTFEIDRHHFL
jgi:hypothetical protein